MAPKITPSSNDTGAPRKRMTTQTKVLALLRDRAPIALSSHGLGLQIQDADRSISVILKTLSRDGYIHAVGKKGARTALWGITQVGLESLRRRAEIADEARSWLQENPSYRETEQILLLNLDENEPTSITEIADATGLRVVDIRKDIKRVVERGLVNFNDDEDTVVLNKNGVEETNRLKSKISRSAASKQFNAA